jgi:SAM-dependent methyltransferase
VNDWTRGYRTDVNYTSGYYPYLNPAAHAFALLAAGWRPPQLDRPFAYAELGAGHALSVQVHAAAAPHGRFFANDFMPAHIATAQARVEATGLTNIDLTDASFAEYIDAPLPKLDAVVMHGVWSWVDLASRTEILRFLRKFLKPGGYAFVSYNVLPGWAPIMPLRELLRTGIGNDSTDQLNDGLAFAQKLRDADAGWFNGNDAARAMLDRMRGLPNAYLAHEYMNDTWQLFYHHDVAKELDGAQMHFAASAAPRDLVDELMLSEEQHALLASIPEGPRRETARDFCTNPLLRRDLFLRGGVRLSKLEQLHRLSEMSFVLNVPRARVELKLSLPGRSVTLPHETYAPILDALRDGVRNLMQIREAIGEHDDISRTIHALKVLVGADLIVPCLPHAGLADRKVVTDRFNEQVLFASLHEAELDVLASPVTGGGFRLDRIDRLFVFALKRNASDFAGVAWQVMSQLGEAVLKDGQPLLTDDANLAELRQREALFRSEMLPLLKQLQLV